MFPDIANVAFIRAALWRHREIGNASIMIGAGFSRNADPVSAAARPLPGWSEMAQALCRPLYDGDQTRLAAALAEASGTSGFLRLAQEYQAAFGGSALSDTIRSLVPDLEHRPGDLHKRLLRLPWADIFSTNWDTLLERGCSDVFERSYDIVRTVEQIPYAKRPRIIKLHGTFPAHEPFIFTEEDYRTFPAAYAPMVNLVQQSMMETIFCLLGFSGDDPNFLHWSGWVRDNLGERAPKIYLVGWLDLSIHRRRMLEDRHVMPVDLSLLPQAARWPHELRQRYAAEWFIRALEAGRPYDTSNWPSAAAPTPPVPAHLHPLPAIESVAPRREPLTADPSATPEQRVKALLQAVDVWAHNRRLYPGWMVAPEHVRNALWSHTLPWIDLTRSAIDGLTSTERLRTLCELAWRLNRCLFPLISELEEPAFAALASLDPIARKIGGEDVPEGSTWPGLLRGTIELALALVRNARHAGDQPKLERALAHLTPMSTHAPEVAHAISYERCLWLLATGDLQALRSALNAWLLADGDTAWLLRKAGLLAELQDDQAACANLENALAQIRRNRRRDMDDIVSLSRESWALFLALAYMPGRGFLKSPELPDDVPVPFQRWREMAVTECDAYGDYHTFLGSLEHGEAYQPDVTKRRNFDPDRQGVTYHMRHGPSRTLLAAYEMMLMAEDTGIPPTASHMTLFKDGLVAAAKILASQEPWLASQVAVRVGSDELIDDVFSRARVAALDMRFVTLLCDSMLKRTAYGLANLQSSAGMMLEWLNLTGGAIEVLSRLVIRLPVAPLKALFAETLSYYRSAIFRRRSVHLGQPLSHLLARVLEAMPDAELEALLPRLFALPLVREPDLDAADEGRWTDPVALLRDDYKPSNLVGGRRAGAWTAIIARLCDAALGSDNANREIALFRLYKLWDWQLLSDSERQQFASALWAPTHIGDSGLPTHARFYPWAYLRLPAPPDVNPKALLERLLARLAEGDDGAAHDRLKTIGALLWESERQGISLAIAPATLAAFEALVRSWAAKTMPSQVLPLFSHEEDRREGEALVGIRAILPRIALNESLAAKIWQRVSDLDGQRERDIRPFVLYPVLTRLFPAQATQLSARLQRALASDLEHEARLAVQALYDWTHDAMRQPDHYQLPDQELYREVSIAIANRRPAILTPALNIARWLFAEGPSEIATLIADDCAHGLNALLTEASYTRRDASPDVPSIRAACVRLACAMAGAGFGERAGIQNWIDAASGDPLPEVRRAASRGSE